MNWSSRIHCNDVNAVEPGRAVEVAGWVDALRDHGNLRFIHLRDASGIVQVVFDPERSPASFVRAASLKEECVVWVRGTLRRRAKGTENTQIDTGDLEVDATEMVILSSAAPLPFKISEKALIAGAATVETEHVTEELRLRHRYLDLRRPTAQARLRARHAMIREMRAALDSANFIEVETPTLTRSTPEGARDFLVPSRTNHGEFFALPQSPQLFKQMLMVGGVERYYQVARCWRDEDMRPNRQPEFTQLDVEAAFIDQGFVMDTMEDVTRRAFRAVGHTLPAVFPKMTYADAMATYGSDKPDLRPGMPFFDLTPDLRGTQYSIFKRIIGAGGIVTGICVKGQARALSKNELQNTICAKVVPTLGGRGMTWMKRVEGQWVSNITQFFSQSELDAIANAAQAVDGDVVMMVADIDPAATRAVLGRLRLYIAERFDLGRGKGFMPLWVTDFPMFEVSENHVRPMHHPFTLPSSPDFDAADPAVLSDLKACSYDLVINGEELGGGSLRIYDEVLQRKVFSMLGLSPEVQEERFGFFLKALAMGAPPHGGMAIGVDRMVAMALGVTSIREIIAFPKNGRGVCPLTMAPATVENAQLKELGLRRPRARLVS